MPFLDPVLVTSATCPPPPLDGRPCPGKPGDGNAAGWGATASFLSLLTQCSQTPATADETAPAAAAMTPTAAVPAPAMPFVGLATDEPAAEAADTATTPQAGGLAAAVVAGAPVISVADALVDDVVASAAPEGEAATGTTEPAPPYPLPAWPAPAGGPLVAARPVKPPTLGGYRPWTAADLQTAPPAKPAEMSDHPRSATLKPSSPPVWSAATATAVLAPPVDAAEVSDAVTAGRPAAPASPGTTSAPAPPTPPATPAPTDPAGLETAPAATPGPAAGPAPTPASATPASATAPAPTPEGAASVVASTAGASNGAESGDGHPQSDGKKGEPEAADLTASVATAGVDAAANPVATISPLMRAVLGAASTADAASTPPAGTSGDALDPATGASIRAQLLAEVAAQSAGATGHERIVLQLEPEHLGKVQVQLQASGSRLEIVVQAQNPEAENALADGAQELVEAIIGAGEGRWQQVDVRFERSPGEREQRQQKDEPRGGGEQRRGNQQGRRRDERAGN